MFRPAELSVLFQLKRNSKSCYHRKMTVLLGCETSQWFRMKITEREENAEIVSCKIESEFWFYLEFVEWRNTAKIKTNMRHFFNELEIWKYFLSINKERIVRICRKLNIMKCWSILLQMTVYTWWYVKMQHRMSLKVICLFVIKIDDEIKQNFKRNFKLKFIENDFYFWLKIIA